MLSSILALALAIIPAHAGKLAGGFRGVPFGDAKAIAEAPYPGCQRAPSPTIAWFCPTATIGEVPVSVAFMVYQDVYLGVFIQAKGYQARLALMAALTEAWGESLDGGAQFVGLWRDGDVVASLAYNQFNGAVTVVIGGNKAQDEADRRRAEQAKGAAGDL